MTTHHLAQRRTETPLGSVTLARSSRGLSGLWFDGQKHHPGRLDLPEVAGGDVILDTAEAALHAYFAGGRFELPPLDPVGTDFQQAVWRALLHIEPGRCQSYGGLAQVLGRARAVRAVGAAVGRNPISILVPCHRVLGADGSLTGYAGGLARKRALLEREGAL